MAAGGAVSCSTGQLELHSSSIVDNWAEADSPRAGYSSCRGAGVYGKGVTYSISKVTFSGNRCYANYEAYGGGLDSSLSGGSRMNDTVFRDNTALASGSSAQWAMGGAYQLD